MRFTMASVAILCLLLLERFLASDMDSITQPVLNGLRSLEKTAMKFSPNKNPSDVKKTNRKLTSFYLFTPEIRTTSLKLDLRDRQYFRYFNPRIDTKIIIHGFLDKAIIAGWMHKMKDEFLMYDDFNVIIVDWSIGNFIPYTQAAANTAQVGEEISRMIAVLRDDYGAEPSKFHLIGHSLGSHVAGYVGERIKGLKRITGLDPATYLFSDASPRTRLDPSDADFVDAIHTDAGGIGMIEPVGHVDFYPNGGELQPGCTASNSLKSLLEFGVVEGFRTMICSHMRVADFFTESINNRGCQMLGYKCSNWTMFLRGNCDTCGPSGDDCAVMGYHIDSKRKYENRTKFYMYTSNQPPFCGYEYKITLFNSTAVNGSGANEVEWSRMDVLHLTVYGSSGKTEFKIEGRESGWMASRIMFSNTFLGDVYGSVIRWSKKPISRAKGIKDVVSKVIKKNKKKPFIRKINLFPLKSYTQWRIMPIVFELCVSRGLSEDDDQQGASFMNEYC